MMRYKFLVFLAVGGMALACAPAYGADGVIAFIDLDKAFNEYEKTMKADAQLQDRAGEFNEERQAMIGKFKALQETFNTAREEAQNTALSEEVRNQRRDEAEEQLLELREQESKIRKFDESRKKQLQEQTERMKSRLVGEILEIVQDFATGEGYRAVLDISGQSLNQVEVVLYADPKVDITDKIIEILNVGSQE